jgi:hypothetical protein
VSTGLVEPFSGFWKPQRGGGATSADGTQVRDGGRD